MQFTLDTERLSAMSVSVNVDPRGNVTFEDCSKPLRLFTDDAVMSLVKQFGEHRADSMLCDASTIINTAILGEKIRKALL